MTICLVLQQCISTLYNKTPSLYNNVDIISTRKPLRRMIDFILYAESDSNPKFIIEKRQRMVAENLDKNKENMTKSQPILCFHNIADVLEEEDEQKNENHDHSRAFFGLFYGGMFERCMFESTKDTKLSVDQWIKQYTKNKQSIKALVKLSYNDVYRKDAVNVLVLNDVDGILVRPNSAASTQSDTQPQELRCELKSMQRGKPSKALNDFGQAKVK